MKRNWICRKRRRVYSQSGICSTILISIDKTKIVAHPIGYYKPISFCKLTFSSYITFWNRFIQAFIFSRKSFFF
ncbi:uncharacterized protein BX663DRAFT_508797 [Cokeromyces recurvatus]|uniref:uncharacterized protein n=1 Tax=Cokeromyces recurvatus TaxID=90255 RepID=UPI00221F98CF|nr:uncharacterized protein BX663DRAFT_508797 [Cokeromyces recurvatus]KAI7902896.1 hypothetical protein BX663DRAFT_508797 [Cokeromyces recurvatus]